MKKIIVEVTSREVTENLNQLRAQSVPANIFESGKKSTSIKVDKKVFITLYRQVGESGVAYLSLGTKEIPAMIEEVQWHPVTNIPIHVSFRAVDLKQKTEAFIPVELIGQFEIPEAVLVTVRDEIEVRALPADLPEKFVVNVEQLTEVGQSITLADLEYDKNKVEILVSEEGEDAPVVLVQEVKEEIEEEVEEVETEVIGEEKEGEAETEKEEKGEDVEKKVDNQEGEDKQDK